MTLSDHNAPLHCCTMSRVVVIILSLCLSAIFIFLWWPVSLSGQLFWQPTFGE